MASPVVVSLTEKPLSPRPVVVSSVPVAATAHAGTAVPATTAAAVAATARPARMGRLPVLGWDLRMRRPPTVSKNRVVDGVSPRVAWTAGSLAGSVTRYIGQIV